jgi:hypothetical protein
MTEIMEEPITFSEAVKDKGCKEAMQKEIDSILKNNTWEVVIDRQINDQSWLNGYIESNEDWMEPYQNSKLEWSPEGFSNRKVLIMMMFLFRSSDGQRSGQFSHLQQRENGSFAIWT